MTGNGDVLRVANCSGFYGDRASAAREMVEGGPIDVLTGDYLAELTMGILAKNKMERPDGGYARTFLQQMEEVLGTCVERGIKVVSNAGGLNPAALAHELRVLADKLGLSVEVAHIEGDDLTAQLAALRDRGIALESLDTGESFDVVADRVVTANVYLGAWGIAEALRGGADVVVCPRVADASVVVGPAAWRFGWSRDDLDRLAGATVAGHVLECGAHATGGNYAFFTEIPSWPPGFPLAEVHADGSSVITKHPGTGGLVSTDTVIAQLLYEIGPPGYITPDVVARFDSFELTQDGKDRVRISGARGEPAPETLKLGVTYLGGFRNSMTMVLTGLNIDEKAKLIRDAVFDTLGGEDRFDEVSVRLIRGAGTASSIEEDASLLRIAVLGRDGELVGKRFANAVIEAALSNYPGFFPTTPPQRGTMYPGYWPTLIPREVVTETVVQANGERIEVEGADPSAGKPADVTPRALPPAPTRPTRAVPIGTIIGARSGDKGGNANLGVWARTDEAAAWLLEHLTVERLKEMVPDAAALHVERHELPNLRALNFVLVGYLGRGVGANALLDGQAKGLGEFFRARVTEIPESLLP